jgi:hypothetical protein
MATAQEPPRPPHEGARPTRRGHVVYTPQQRAAMAVAYALHRHAGLTLAEALEAAWDKAWGEAPPNATHHCKKWFERLAATGSTLGLPHPGRPRVRPAAADGPSD